MRAAIARSLKTPPAAAQPPAVDAGDELLVGAYSKLAGELARDGVELLPYFAAWADVALVDVEACTALGANRHRLGALLFELGRAQRLYRAHPRSTRVLERARCARLRWVQLLQEILPISTRP